MNARTWAAAAAIAFATLMPAPALAQQDWAKVEIKIEKLAGSTYMLTGAGGNLGVSVGDDAVLIVDDQFAPLAPRIQAAIATLSKQPVRFVLNTHWHYDHTGGNEALGKGGAAIVAHANVRRRMSADQVIQFVGSSTAVKASPKAALPVVTFTSDVAFHVNGEDVQVFHVPAAHTDGDAIVHFRQSKVVHMGDVYFNRLYPFIDASSGGTLDGVIAACDRVLALVDDETKIIPGHGPLASKADLKAYRDMLATIGDRLKAQAGRKLEEVIASKPTAEFDAVWGGGFLPPDRFVTMLWGMMPKR
ncbi:MBL fold metallo-hydrolase [Aquabacterium humicola]|uniref:MBL fold metallo-hydrolase n=1 Tax=Aquabacterium humicola TaxID=3237377 RepID=UPI002542E4B3|nr:MBL fold metallo-hydrolase [Rubrivivax pictus]